MPATSRLATTFHSQDDLFKAAKDLIETNERKLNDWFARGDEERLGLWSYIPENVRVRGRRKLARPAWHRVRPRCHRIPASPTTTTWTT